MLFCGKGAIVTESNFRRADVWFTIPNVQGKRVIYVDFTVCPNPKCREFTLSASMSSVITAGKPTLKAAAKAMGVSAKTLQRLRKTPEFREAFQEAQGELVKTAIAQLTLSAGPAAQVLRKIFSNPCASDAARTSAAVNTLRLTLDAYELSDLAERIAKLEENIRETS